MKTLGKILAVAIIILGFGIPSSYAGTPISEMESGKELKVAFLPQHIDQMVVTFESQGDEVQVNLKNEKGNFVHSEAVNGKGVFTKRYDLSELEKGIYSFEIRKGDQQYTKTVVLK